MPRADWPFSPLITRRTTVTVLLAGAAFIGLLFVPRETAHRWTDEDGPVEVLTAIVFGIGAVVAGVEWVRRPRQFGWLSGSGVLLALCLRELDFHKRFTAGTISSTHFYISGEVSWQQKLVVIAVVAVGLGMLVHLWRIGARPAWAAWQQRAPWTGDLLVGLIALVVSRVVEKTHIPVLYYVEELAELVFALLLLFLVLEFRRRSTPADAPQQPHSEHLENQVRRPEHSLGE